MPASSLVAIMLLTVTSSGPASMRYEAVYRLPYPHFLGHGP